MVRSFFLKVCAFLGLAVFFCGAVPLAAEQQPVQYPQDIQRIIDRGELRVAMLGIDMYPLFYTALDGSVRGSDVTLSEQIAKELGVRLRIIRTEKTFDGVVDTVVRGDADMAISFISMTSKRALRCRFSQPYLKQDIYLVADRRTNSAVIKNAVFCELMDSAYIEIARQLYPDAQILTCPSWDNVMQAVADGNAQYSIRDEVGVTNFMHANKRLSLRLKLTPIKNVQDSIAVALPIESEALVQWLNTFLYLNNFPKTVKQVFEIYGER